LTITKERVGDTKYLQSIFLTTFKWRCIMPRRNGTGPMGMGPMTGRGEGYCVKVAIPGFINSLCGRGMGRGHGRGRGFGMGMAWRRGWAGAGSSSLRISPNPCKPEIVPENEVEFLRNQAKYFSEALEGINKRIAEFETEKK
jgi:hypothetical protein